MVTSTPYMFVTNEGVVANPYKSDCKEQFQIVGTPTKNGRSLSTSASPVGVGHSFLCGPSDQ